MTPPLTRETLAEIRRLNAERTQGEWQVKARGYGIAYLDGFNETSGLVASHDIIRPGKSDCTVAHTDYEVGPYSRGYPAAKRYTGPVHPDAALIALAINNLDALLAAAERGLDVEGGR